jgi:hypothetical protein
MKLKPTPLTTPKIVFPFPTSLPECRVFQPYCYQFHVCCHIQTVKFTSAYEYWAGINFRTHQPSIGIELIKKNFHTSLVLILGSKADLWIVWGKHMPGIETGTALVWSSCPYLVSIGTKLILAQVPTRQVWDRYSLNILGLGYWSLYQSTKVILYIPRFQPGTSPTLVLTHPKAKSKHTHNPHTYIHTCIWKQDFK